jgi:hypothetical protein
MNATYWPTPHDLEELFAEEITAAGGTVTDVYNDGTRLFARSTLPQVLEVRPKDKVQGGVALRSVPDEIQVHPYVFRQVCRNGAIMAHALETLRLEAGQFPDAPDSVVEVTAELRQALRACCTEEAFAASTEEMRSAGTVEADLTIQLLPYLAGLPRDAAEHLLQQIMRGFERGRDRSAFGLINAVTAVARETRDPETRWRLEELGGGIGARLRPTPRPGDASARAVLTA